MLRGAGCGPSWSSGPTSCRPAPRSCARRGERLVDAQDDERRRLERDIHDGAQQHLVALAVNLRLAADAGASAPERADALLAAAGGGGRARPWTRWSGSPAASTRRCSTDAGPRGRPARRSPAPVRCPSRSSVRGRRQATRRGSRRRRTSAAWRRCRTPPSTRGATSVRVDLRRGRRTPGLVRRRTTAAGFDPARLPAGAGLANMRDRVESVGGTLDDRPRRRRGTRSVLAPRSRSRPARSG